MIEIWKLCRGKVNSYKPAVFIYLIYTFKDDVRRLVAGRVLKKGKILGTKFELEAQLDQLEEKTAALPEAARSQRGA